MNFGSVNELLDFAIGKEIEAAAFYQGLAARVEKPWMQKAFEDFAREELGHKVKLEGVKAGNFLQPSSAKITDLKIADYLVDVEPSPDMEYQEALIVAMKMEKAAFKLYMNMAQSTEDAAMQATLTALAQEEARHKLRFELEYDEFVQKDN